MQRSWILSQKGEDYYADTLFYVFVNVSEDSKKQPEFTVVPSKVVADYIRKSHVAWLKLPTRAFCPSPLSA
jgi:hypothetical protein